MTGFFDIVNDGGDILAGNSSVFFEAGDVGHVFLQASGGDITVASTRNDPNVIEVTTVNAGGGDDRVTVLEAGQRYLVVHGQSGRDIIDATATTTGLTAFGDSGDDTIQGDAGDDVLSGGLNNDRVFGQAGNDILLGDDTRIFRDAAYVVQRIETDNESQGGNDTLDDSAGDDVLLGGAGGDVLRATQGSNIILGDNGVVVRNDESPEANDVFSHSLCLGDPRGDRGKGVVIAPGFSDAVTGFQEARGVAAGPRAGRRRPAGAWVPGNASRGSAMKRPARRTIIGVMSCKPFDTKSDFLNRKVFLSLDNRDIFPSNREIFVYISGLQRVIYFS